ncbi:n-acetyltransferase domain-containing protein [Trichonephila inaurata madagascariensis]|uniref:N-acetyltransferase domain-containing protein n=1 Tax=Trichonephila inaurata madagascariensis TaxID=2747483 RepID=A0A8X6YCP2_9ARAC|nr:n-acetyltransferase domain-containing protein [Trichonephila inaurata madagascariensis]
MMSCVVRQSVRFLSSSRRKMMEELKRAPSAEFWIRPMKVEEIPKIAELTRPYYFHFSPCSLKFWHKQDPDGLAIAVNESGEIIGALFTVKNTENLYIGGLFCVHGNYRQLEVGRKLLQESYDHSKDKNLIANVDVHQIMPTTRRGVGVLETDWKSIEYETDTPLNPSMLSDDLPRGVEILPSRIVSFQQYLNMTFPLGATKENLLWKQVAMKKIAKPLWQ